MSMIERLESYPHINRWFLRQVRDCQKLVIAHELLEDGLRLHKVIRGRDLYICAPPPPNTDVKVIRLRHNGWCMSKRCGQAMPVGMQAIWIHGVGEWHLSCWDADQAAGLLPFPELR